MQIESKIIKIENNGDYSTEYVEHKLLEYNIEPLRWAIVKIDPQNVHINVAYRVN